MKRFLAFDDGSEICRYCVIDTQIIHFEAPKYFWLSMAIFGNEPFEDGEIVKLDYNRYMQLMRVDFAYLGQKIELEDLPYEHQKFLAIFIRFCNTQKDFSNQDASNKQVFEGD